MKNDSKNENQKKTCILIAEYYAWCTYSMSFEATNVPRGKKMKVKDENEKFKVTMNMKSERKREMTRDDVLDIVRSHQRAAEVR